MIALFAKRNGMNLVGQGGKIALFTLPSLIAAVWAQASLRRFTALPDSAALLRPAGYALLAAGLLLWGTAVIQLLGGFSRGRLVTRGAYGIVRNPIYSSMALFVLPAVSLLTQSWAYFVPAAFLAAGVMIFIRKEEAQLARAFGKEYDDYRARVDRLFPLQGLKIWETDRRPK